MSIAPTALAYGTALVSYTTATTTSTTFQIWQRQRLDSSMIVAASKHYWGLRKFHESFSALRKQLTGQPIHIKGIPNRRTNPETASVLTPLHPRLQEY